MQVTPSNFTVTFDRQRRAYLAKAVEEKESEEASCPNFSSQVLWVHNPGTAPFS